MEIVYIAYALPRKVGKTGVPKDICRYKTGYFLVRNYPERDYQRQPNVLFVYLLIPAAQHCFAADAAGAAPELGAILGRGGAPSLVPVGRGRQRRR